MIKYNLSLIGNAQLASVLTDSATEMELMPGQGAEFTQPPAIGVLALSRSLGDLAEAEHIKLVERTGDVITIERAIIGTAVEWPAGTLLLGYWSPEHIYQINRNVDAIEQFLNFTVGAGKASYVVARSGKQFDATAGTGLNVNVSVGCAFANYKLISIVSASVLTFTAPSVSTRIDLIQANADTNLLEVKLGIEGGAAPTVDSNCIALYEVTTTVGQVTRLIGDLTDVRVY